MFEKRRRKRILHLSILKLELKLSRIIRASFVMVTLCGDFQGFRWQ